GGCQVPQQPGGPGPGGRVGGDAGGVVGGQDRPVQGGGFQRRQLLADQDRHHGVQEQRPAGQRVGAAVTGGDVQGVEPHPGCAELDDGAADALGEADVLVFGVD